MDIRRPYGSWHSEWDEDVHVRDDATDNSIRWKNSNNGIIGFQ